MMKKLRIAINGIASINRMLLIAYSVFAHAYLLQYASTNDGNSLKFYAITDYIIGHHYYSNER